MKTPYVITALDTDDIKTITRLVRSLKGLSPYFKIGLEAFYSQGKKILDVVHKEGGKIFLDLKFHDIPNTVEGAVKAVMHPSIFMLNAHCLGGSNLLKAFKKSAVEKAKQLKMAVPKLIGVTLLTSLSPKHLKEEFKIKNKLAEQVKHLALLAKKSGLHGVVCSPHEIKIIKKACGGKFLAVTPGIRTKDSKKGDQERITTPEEAAKQGADYLVIGRPVTKAKDPEKALKEILESINQWKKKNRK
ncbi:MAG: orotidine-5'-phosphate decarboxylase [Armatimonadota bacterium]